MPSGVGKGRLSSEGPPEPGFLTPGPRGLGAESGARSGASRGGSALGWGGSGPTRAACAARSRPAATPPCKRPAPGLPSARLTSDPAVLDSPFPVKHLMIAVRLREPGTRKLKPPGPRPGQSDGECLWMGARSPWTGTRCGPGDAGRYGNSAGPSRAVWGGFPPTLI